MNLVVTGVFAGVLGTLMMDTLNALFARTGMISKIDVSMIGRMAAGWAKGRFRYSDPAEIEKVAHETLYGYLMHYAIGLGLALIYIFGWALLVGGPVSAAWALVYGIATTVASLFLVLPSMGLGMCGRRSPGGIKSSLSPLVNHLCYGLGMAVAVSVV